MSTSVHSHQSENVPKTIVTQRVTHTMDVKPRIRRRIPNAQKPSTGPSTKKTVLRSTPSKPTSATSRPTSATSHPTSVTSRPTSATSHQKSGKQRPTVNQRPSSGPTSGEEQELEHDTVFIDVSNIDNTKLSRLQPTDIEEISPADILEQSQERSYDKVYQADLHASHIAIIDNIHMFTKLRVLDLSCNVIQHIDNLDRNTDLRELKLYDNDVVTIENLDKLKELHHLQLQHNRIKAIGKGLQSLRKLRILRLDSNNLCRLEVREVANSGYLTSLDLSNNKLDSIAAVSCLVNLEELFVVNNRLRTIADLSRCKKLQEVDISYNRLADVAGLKGLSQLTCLHVSNNQLNSLKSLGKLKGLQELNIKCNRVTDTKHLSDFYPQLQVLDVSDNHLETWQQLEKLAVLHHLVELYISGNPIAGNSTGGNSTRSEATPRPGFHSDVRAMLPALDMLDGALLRKPGSRPGTALGRPGTPLDRSATPLGTPRGTPREGQSATPLMRPMSASSVVTSRVVESQLKSMDDEMTLLEQTFASKFESVCAVMSKLPTECSTSRPGTSSSAASARPVSRAGKRSRIQLAQQFAAHKYAPEGDS